jgi:hypothetical protein
VVSVVSWAGAARTAENRAARAAPLKRYCIMKYFVDLCEVKSRREDEGVVDDEKNVSRGDFVRLLYLELR